MTESLPCLPSMPESLDDLYAERVRTLVANRFGYTPRPAALAYLRSVLEQRRAGRGHEEYWRLLEDSKRWTDELQQLVEDILVHDTVCGRTPPHFDALRRHILPELGRSGRLVRIASLGCATGEETYTLALAALEALGRDYPIEIVGFDLSQRALNAARIGLYSACSLRELDAEERERGFTRFGDGFRVRPELAAMVRFAAHNVLTPLPLVGVDVVFCRNVLIYFDAAAAKRVLSNIRDALAPGGWLFLGHTESALQHREWFEPVSYAEARAYRRR